MGCMITLAAALDVGWFFFGNHDILCTWPTLVPAFTCSSLSSFSRFYPYKKPTLGRRGPFGMTDGDRLLCSVCGNNIDAYFENNRIMGPWDKAKAMRIHPRY